MSVIGNKAIVREYFEAGGRNDLAAWDQLCDPNMVLHTGMTEPIQGRPAIQQFTALMHSAFSDLYLTVEDLIAEGDRVVARYSLGGTQTAPLHGPGGVIPPTGRTIATTGISIVRVVNGKIVEERAQLDTLGMMQQLGVIPAPEPAGA